MSVLAASDLRVALGERLVVDGLDLALDRGEVVALIGPNGAGKTTLMRALAGLLPTSAGAVRFDGQPADALSHNARARAVAYLPQGGTSHWPLLVRRVVELGRLPHRAAFSGLSEVDRAAIDRAIDAADIGAFVDRPFDQLSGGERARVLLARALAVEAAVLLVDEPVAALDPAHQLHVMEILRERAKGGTAVIAVLHDLVLAARFSDRILLMDRGKAVAEGAPAAVLTDATLRAVYGVEAIEVKSEAGSFAMPWRRIDSENFAER